MRTRTSISLISLLLFALPVFAGIDQLSYQGRILKTDGTPFEHNNVSFLFEITNPSGNCVIYREQKNGVNMTGSSGVFDVPIGSGTKLFPLSASVGLLEIFSNSQPLDCGDASNNVSGSYTPSTTHGRLLFVQFHDGTGWMKIRPETEIRAVPYAGYATAAESANTLNGKTAADFVAKNLIPNCPASTFLTYSGGAFTCAGVSGASGGTVTDVTSANSYLTITNGTSVPSLTLNVGTTASTVAAGNDARFGNALKIQNVAVDSTAPTSGQFLKYDGSKWIPATLDAPSGDGSALTNLNPSALSAVVPIAKGGTGQSTSTAAFNALSPLTSRGDLLTRDASGNIRLAVGTDGQILSADSAQSGGLKWITPTVGTVTNVTATAPLTVATGGTTPAISISAGTATAQVLRWNSTAWASSYFSFADLKSSAGLTQIPNNCSASQTLVWQTPSDTFACTNLSVSGANFAAQTAGVVFAGPTSGSATPTFRAIASTDLPVTGTGGVFVNGGNSFAAATAIGTNDSQNLGFKTNTATNMVLNTAGKLSLPGTIFDDILTLHQVDGSGGLTIYNTSSTGSRSPGIVIKNYGGSTDGNPTLVMGHGGGTYASPAALASGKNMGTLQFMGHNGNSNWNVGAQVHAESAEAFSTSAGGTIMTFLTAKTGTTSPAERVRIDAAGNIGIGASTINNLLQVGPNGSQANKYGVYVGSYLSSAGSAQYVGNWTSSGYWGLGPATNASDKTIRLGNTTDALGTWNATQDLIFSVGGKIGIGTIAPTSPLTVMGGALFGDKSTFPSDFNTIESNTYTNSLYNNTATSGTYGAFGSWMRVSPAANSTLASQAISAGLSFNVPSSVTVTSNSEALWLASSRNRYTANTDNGTVSSLRGISLTYGHESSVPGNTPTTTNAYGIVINPAAATGTITNMYDIYLGSRSAGATVANHYSIYQSDAAAKNIFMGNTGLNGAPTTLLTANSTGYLYSTSPISIESGATGGATRIGVANGGTGRSDSYYHVCDAGSTDSCGLMLMQKGVRVAGISAGGSFYVGSPNDTYKFFVNGTAAGTSAYVSTSDRRLKKDIRLVPESLEKILTLNGVTFDWRHDVRPDLKFDNHRDMGLIAQDVEKAFPEAVTTDQLGFKAVGYTKLFGPMVEAFKEFYHKWSTDSAELHQQISQQQREISSLKEELSTVKKALCAKDKSLEFCPK